MFGTAIPLWALLAFVFSFIGALLITYNQWARQDGRHLTLHRYPGVLVASLGMLPWVTLPTNLSFYLPAAAMGIALAYSDILLADASHKHGGRLTALYIPLKMFMVFFAWLAIDTAQRNALFAAPLTLVGILACLAACAWAISHLRRSDASVAALKAILPVAALLALADVVAKLLLNTPHDTSTPELALIAGGAVGWMLATGAVAALTSAVLLKRHRQPLGAPLQGMLQGFIFGMMLLGAITILLMALALAPNPGYVGAITMLSAVWLAIWAYFKKGERTNLRASLTLIASAFALTLLTH